ncbi:MAG TPA: hypothetical protein ENK59_04780 [Thioploca sp.]|nr:hypothetical protein [Thioploca sp.]
MPEETKIPQLQLRYEQTTALYASQFVISTNGEEVIINFSSGGLPDKDTSYLPVHTRIALTATGAKNLANLINQALSESNKITNSKSLDKVIH